MGVFINDATVNELVAGLHSLMLEQALELGRKLPLSDSALAKLRDVHPVAVRSSDGGVDCRFYLDVENGCVLITPASYYEKEGAK